MSEDNVETIEEFKYSIAQQKEFFVVSFIGILNGRAGKKIEECLARLQESECRYLILNFKDATQIEPTAYRFLVQLQHSIRKFDGKVVRSCGVNTAWKTMLIDNGIIRGNEITSSIKSALVEMNKLR